MTRLHPETDLFGVVYFTADDTESEVEAILTLADALLEHGRMMLDAAKMIAEAKVETTV